MKFENRVTRMLGVEIPIVQAPMGWIARSQLASAVCNAGAMGIIETSSGELDAIRVEIEKMRQLTDRPFGVNIAQAFVRDPKIVEFVVEQGVKFVTTSAGSPTKYTKQLKDAGLTVFHVVPSLRGALKAVDAGVDGLIVEGGEGGGFKSHQEVASFVLLPLIRERVDVPIIAAGGICDGPTMAAAFALGAEGVQMGTRMVSSTESPVHEGWKTAITKAAETDTVLLKPSGGPALRAIRTELTERLEREPDTAMASLGGNVRAVYFEGRIEEGVALTGQVAGRIDAVRPVADVIRETASDFFASVERLNKEYGARTPEASADPMYRLFSWEHSYFSGKVRAYLRYKSACGGLGPGYEDILATPELCFSLLIPATGTQAVPQLQTPDGEWVQDSSEIIDHCERSHSSPAVVPPPSSPRQRLAAYLIELLADEWMVVYGFWERWFYSLPSSQPNHERFNAQQWGGFLNATGSGEERLERARQVFSQGLAPKDASAGVYAGIRALGLTERTRAAWEASNSSLLERLETHFGAHDFALGGRPSLADFGLMGPLYAHLFRDAVPGFWMRTRHPLVAEWVERTNGTNALNARSYNQKLYTLGADGELIGQPATSDSGEWLRDDEIPPTLLPVLEVFFAEMWPMLRSSIETLTRYMQSGDFAPGSELPGKTFFVTPGFEHLQAQDGPLTHEFSIGGVRERRMVVPYHAWMLQRLATVVGECASDDPGSVEQFVAQFEGGPALLELDGALAGCRVRKEGGRIFGAV